MNAKFPRLLAITLTIAGVLAQLLQAKQEPAPPFEPTHPWLTDLDQALAAAKRTGKPILAEFR